MFCQIWLESVFIGTKYDDVLFGHLQPVSYTLWRRGGARRSPFAVNLSEDERRHLESMVPIYVTDCDIIRSKIVLLAAEGLANDVIASRLDTPPPDHQQMAQTVLPGAFARPEGRTPPWAEGPLFPSLVVQLKLSPESCHRRACPCRASRLPEILDQGLVAEISGATIWRWLTKDAIRPRRHRSWIFARDPLFVEKAGPIVDLCRAASTSAGSLGLSGGLGCPPRQSFRPLCPQEWN